jgi:hypothetical protein
MADPDELYTTIQIQGQFFTSLSALHEFIETKYTVSKFLNHLIVPLHLDHSTFSDGLKGFQGPNILHHGTLNVDDKNLRRFLDGYVFFNHFIRVNVKLSYSMFIHAWNRGAAIMCMTNTEGVDYVIPVMLDTEGDVKFGPLHCHLAKSST